MRIREIIFFLMDCDLLGCDAVYTHRQCIEDYTLPIAWVTFLEKAAVGIGQMGNLDVITV
jgi:hypothetical protein